MLLNFALSERISTLTADCKIAAAMIAVVENMTNDQRKGIWQLSSIT